MARFPFEASEVTNYVDGEFSLESLKSREANKTPKDNERRTYAEAFKPKKSHDRIWDASGRLYVSEHPTFRINHTRADMPTD
ncbi:hypothetical protein N7456_007388 [Penicillium angulare]|uniref:Uncharacterized protein n=1 Tax=Penicillium angulare TaxID=116970 RepID=A0A9W9FB15_9EURO|nr:hypothetical protein N7456_007388 [Penicillium angulare]